MPGGFLDSNVLVYAFTDDPRAAAAQAVLDRGCTISGKRCCQATTCS
jgi:predicted nucleic acid-binding protein